MFQKVVEETGKKLNKRQQQNVLKFLREELKKRDTSLKNNARQWLKVINDDSKQ